MKLLTIITTTTLLLLGLAPLLLLLLLSAITVANSVINKLLSLLLILTYYQNNITTQKPHVKEWTHLSTGQVPQLRRVVRGGGDEVHGVGGEHTIPHPAGVLHQSLLQVPRHSVDQAIPQGGGVAARYIQTLVLHVLLFRTSAIHTYIHTYIHTG